MTSPPPPRVDGASALLRISVEADSSDSLERQEHDLRKLATFHGLDLRHIRIDAGVSGVAKSRPGLTAWLDDAKLRRVGTLLAWKLDRVTRRGTQGLAEVISVLEESNARFLTADGQIDSDNSSFELIASVLASVGKTERALISSRVSSRQAADRRNGRWSKPRPFGYVTRDGKLWQHETEADTVRRMVEAALAGKSLRGIAGMLTDEGVPVPRAGKGQKTSERAAWAVNSVRSILNGVTLVGYYPHGGGYVRNEDGSPVMVTSEPIMTAAQYVRLQTVLSARSTAFGRPAFGAPPKSMITGLLRCGLCGGPMTYDGASPPHKPRARFRCQYRASNASRCAGLTVAADDIEADAVRRVSEYLATLEPGSEALERVAFGWLRHIAPEPTAERDAARDELDAAEAARADLLTARYERHEFSDSASLAIYERLYTRVLARVDAARGVLEAFPEVTNVDGLLDPETLRKALDASDDPADKRVLLRLVVRRITVRPSDGPLVFDWV